MHWIDDNLVIKNTLTLSKKDFHQHFFFFLELNFDAKGSYDNLVIKITWNLSKKNNVFQLFLLLSGTIFGAKSSFFIH